MPTNAPATARPSGSSGTNRTPPADRPAATPFSAQFMAPLMGPEAAAALVAQLNAMHTTPGQTTAGTPSCRGTRHSPGHSHRPSPAQGPGREQAAPRAQPVPRAAAPRAVAAEPPARLPPTLLAGAPGKALAGLSHLLAETLGDQLTLAARRVQAPVAYIEGEERHTWAEVERAADHLACGLLALGLKRGDRLGVLAHNQIEWLLLFHAATRIGVAVVALTPGEDDASLAHLLSDSAAQVVFTLPRMGGQDMLALLGRLQPQLPQLRHVVSLAGEGLNSYASLAATPVDVVRLAQARRQVQASDLAVVLYGPVDDADNPQGAAARPRGAGLSHRGLLATAANHAVHLRISDADLLHLSLPLHQVGGLGFAVLPMLLGGGSLVLAPDSRPERLLALMARHRPTLVTAAPSLLEHLLALDSPGRVDWQAVRLVCAGGAPVPAELPQRLADRMPRAELMTVYGLTETSGAVAITRWQAQHTGQCRTVGTCLPGWQVRVVNASGQPLPQGQVGELWLSGPGVLPAYVGASVGQGLSADGWLMTGDLGAVDTQGTVTLHGRLKQRPVAARSSALPAARTVAAASAAGSAGTAPAAGPTGPVRAPVLAAVPGQGALHASAGTAPARRKKPAPQALRAA